MGLIVSGVCLPRSASLTTSTSHPIPLFSSLYIYPRTSNSANKKRNGTALNKFISQWNSALATEVASAVTQQRKLATSTTGQSSSAVADGDVLTQIVSTRDPNNEALSTELAAAIKADGGPAYATVFSDAATDLTLMEGLLDQTIGAVLTEFGNGQFLKLAGGGMLLKVAA